MPLDFVRNSGDDLDHVAVSGDTKSDFAERLHPHLHHIFRRQFLKKDAKSG